jgi:Rrf2 family protein
MAKIWKMSEGAALAIHAAVLLARRLEASEAHLTKVLQRLARGGVVRGTRGPKGGFRLKRAATEITLLEVYELIEGLIEPGPCAFERPVCRGGQCVLGGLMEKMAVLARDYLGRARLSELTEVFGAAGE